MVLTERAYQVLAQAELAAGREKLEFITPELILRELCNDTVFTQAVRECGGDPEQLRTEAQQYIDENLSHSGGPSAAYSAGTESLLALAAKSSFSAGRDEVGLHHLVNAMWQLQDSYASYYLQCQCPEKTELLQSLTSLEPDAGIEDDDFEYTDEYGSSPEEEISENGIAEYAPCLNDTLTDTRPLIGRKDELERAIQILCRRDKNNPLLIGEPGVGKTALAHGLVQLLRDGAVPEPLLGAKVFSLDLGSLLAGTQYRGDFEKRLKRVLKEISREEKPIIFIDEIHNLTGAGAVGEGSMDASNLLKPYMAEGHIRFMGATTFDEYKRHFEKSRSLARRFQQLEIREPGRDEAVEIIKGLLPGYEEFHSVRYARGIAEYAVDMSIKYISERFLPDKAIDLIDEAGAYRRLHPQGRRAQTVDRAVINTILTKICRVPVEQVSTEELPGLAALEERIKAQVFGQDEAIAQVVNAVKFSRAGLLEEGKPLASLLFVGPTGVGKTEVARTLAKELGVKLLRFDMSEYGEKHSISKLIGSPAGYVGYDDGGLLTEAVRKNPSSVLLLDEIEKAHPDIYTILLQVMDYATLTDNQGRKADFRNVILIMTSNAGAAGLGKAGIGFGTVAGDSRVVMDAVKQTFQPEFRNRLSKIVAFNSMSSEMADLIIRKKLDELSQQLAKKKIDLSVTEEAFELIRRNGISLLYGAREIDRVIRNDIKPLFVDEILFGSLKDGGTLTLTATDGYFAVEAQKRY